MLFWILLALMAVGAVLIVLRPLLSVSPAAAADSDGRIYRDQLAELDRDRAIGLIGEGEAAAARTEIVRRLLSAADGATIAGKAPVSSARRTALAVSVFVPIASLALYLALGSPDLADRPLADRMAEQPDKSDVEALVARVEKHLEQQPGDVRGWRVLAPIYMRMGRYDDAAAAFSKVIAGGGGDAATREGYGTALVAAGGGVVSAEAQKLFADVLKAEADRPTARYYYAEGLRQSGDLEGALAAFDELIRRSPSDAPWLARVRGKRGEVLAALKLPADTPEPPTLAPSQPAAEQPGPTAADVEAAAGMSAGDRQAMIAGMVQSLADRLASAPDDRDGWKRLVRAYMVLGRTDEAQAALARARDVFKSDPEALGDIAAAAKALGLQ